MKDTFKQAAGTPGAFENHEQAFRSGYPAQRSFKSQYPKWNNDLDKRLRTDYGSDYDRDRAFIRHAYEYRYDSSDRSAKPDESRDRV